MRLIQTIIFALGLFIAGSASATEYYWAVSTPGNWNDPNNWAATSGGAGGFGVPSTLTDRAHFDANGQGDCLVDGAITVRGIDTEPAYTGTITQSAGQLLHIGNQGFILDGGSFIGSDATIDLDGSIATAVGTQFTATSGLFDVGAGALFTMYGDFDHNGGTLLFYGGRDINTAVGGTALNNVTVETAGSFTRLYVRGSGHLIVDGDWNFTGASPTEVNLGIVEMRGNLTADMTNLRGGSAVWRFTGTADQTITGHLTDPGIYGFIGAVEIDKPSGTFFTTGIVGFNRALRYYKGAVAFGTGAANKCIIYQSTTLEGNMTFSHLEYRASLGIATVAALPSTTITCTDEFTFGGTFQLVTTGGDIDMLGDIVMNNPALSPQSTRLNIIGTTDQTITGLPSEPTSQGFLGFMTIKKASGTLFLNGHIGFAHHFNYDEGNVVAGTGIDDEVYLFSSTQSQFNGNLTLNDVTFKSENVYSYGITLGSTLTVNGDLTFADALSMQITQAGTVDVKGDIYVNNDLLNGGAATIKLSGATDQTITSSASTGLGALPRLVIDKSAGNVLLVNPLYIASVLTFENGNITTTSGTEVIFANAAMSSGGNDGSYIDGPAQKQGGGSFSFPLGKNGQFRPLAVSGGNAGDVISTEFFDANQTLGTATANNLTISNCEHWTLTRTLATNNLAVGVSWGTGACNIATDLNDARVAGWDGTTWQEHGNGATTGDNTTGTVISSLTIPSYTAFTLGDVSVQDPNTTSWIGGVSTDFFDAKNWTNGKPSGSLNVVIGDGNYTGSNVPIISRKNATVKTLYLGEGGTAMTLQMINRNLKIKGDLFIGSDGTLTTDKNIKIEGSWINQGGTFNPGTGRVVFENSTAPQMIADETFYNLNLKGQNGFDVSLAGDIQVLNSLKILSGNFLGGNHSITIDHKWTDEFGGFVAETSTVVFTAAQVPNATSRIPTETFYNLHINAPGAKVKPKPETIITVNNEFHVIAGEFNHTQDLVNACTVEGVGVGNELRVFDGATLVNKQPTFSEKYSGFEVITMDANSTVIYQSADGIAQTVDATIVYGHLHLKQNTPKITLGGDLSILGNLVNLSGGGNDFNPETGIIMRVFGDLEMGAATITVDGGLFRLNGDWNSGKFTALSGAQVGFGGSSLQNFNQAGLTIPTVILQNTGDGLQLNTPLSISTEFRFNVGVVSTDATSLLVFEDGAVVMNVSNKSFVNGPVGKVGDDAFVFPTGGILTTGGEGFYAPVEISAPSGVGSSMVAEYKHEAQAFGTTLGTGLQAVSDCDYWTLESKNVSETLDVEVVWDNLVCAVDQPEDRTVAYFDGADWQPLSTPAVTDNGGTGSVRGSGLFFPPFMSFPMSLGLIKKTLSGYAKIHKKLDAGYHATLNCELHFQYWEQYQDLDELLTFNVYDYSRTIVRSSTSTNIQMAYGTNYLTYGVGNIATGYYTLEVINQKNEKWYLRFHHQSSLNCIEISPNDLE
jgi:hypothetical protein